MDRPSPARGSLAVLFLTVFLDLIGFGMVIPILPRYAETLHASDLMTGAILASYSAMQLVFSPVWGRVSDRIGRRPVLLVSILGSCVSQLGYAAADTFWGLMIARSLAGVFGANITAAQAYIADVTDERSRAGKMGMLGAAIGLGFIIGPAAGGFLSQLSPRAPYLVAGCLAGLNFVLAFFILKEARPAAERAHARTLTWQAVVQTATTPRILALVVLYFLVTFGFANLESTFTFFLNRRLGFGEREASWVFAYIGVMLILVQGGLVRPLVARLGEKRLVVMGTLLMAIGMILSTWTHGLGLLLVAVAVVSAGNGLNTPSLAALVSRAAPASEQGSVLGVNQAAGALARILGPLAGTFALRYGEGTPYFTAAAVLGISGLFAFVAVAQPRANQAAGATAS